MNARKLKIKAALLVALILLVVAGVLYICLAYGKSSNSLNENLYDIFDEKSINAKVGEYAENERVTSVRGLEVFPDFEYNGTIYSCSYYTLEKNMIDITKSIGEVVLYGGDSSITMCAYEVKNVLPEYMLAIEIEGVFYPYINWRCNNDSLQEFIDVIGPKENLEIIYAKVELIEGETVKKQYVYDEDIEDWAWELLLKNEHLFEDNLSGTKEIEDYTYSEKNVNLIIGIQHKCTKAEYIMELQASGNMSILDKVSKGHHYYEYKFNEEEIIEATKTLAKDYEAYVTD